MWLDILDWLVPAHGIGAAPQLLVLQLVVLDSLKLVPQYYVFRTKPYQPSRRKCYKNLLLQGLTKEDVDTILLILDSQTITLFLAIAKLY